MKTSKRVSRSLINSTNSLINILNHLAAHLANRSSIVELNDIFYELANYADYHFKTEEQVWLEFFEGDKWLSDHKETHHSFMERVNNQWC